MYLVQGGGNGFLDLSGPSDVFTLVFYPNSSAKPDRPVRQQVQIGNSYPAFMRSHKTSHPLDLIPNVSLGEKLRPPEGGDIFVNRPIEQALELMVANGAEHPHVRTWKKQIANRCSF